MTNHMNFDVDNTVPMKTMHCFLQSKALYQGPHRFISSAIWPSGLGTGDKWNEVCLQVYCRYNSSGVQNHQHVNTDRIHESNLPPMLCTVWHKYWIIYTKSTHFHLKATVKHEACMSPEPVKAGVKYSKVWNHYVMCFWKDPIVIMITGSISNRLVKHFKCYKCMFLFAVL